MKTIFENNKVDQIDLSKGKVIVVDSDLIPIQGFNLILDNKIQSAPVFDKATQKYTGFLDIRDLVSFCIFIHDNNEFKADTLLDIVNFGVKMFKHQQDVTVTYLSRRNPFKELVLGSPLTKAVELLSHGLHRIPIRDQDGKLVNIISQSSIIQFIDNNFDVNTFPELSKTVSELSLGNAPVLTVKQTTPAIDAFRLMDHNRRSGLAIVNENDVLVGTTSSKDLKIFISNPSVTLLQLPISEFLSKIRQLNIGNTEAPVTATNEDTLKTIIQKMVSSRLHRVFIVDNNQKLLKVVSITDILNLINKKIQQQ
ncbi:cystathionine-beta-synthase domain-containing protein [Tieghemostelium lacteum]|uniref:Cystathionine-beta-synthase domain-containing protein n=1 Tax=Tieghemostelium lacteum TaxID=361077 RepID=A0A151ZGB9_TIELA|nr:cystathionine-beta-synthase domain-containing protein [Tieghemostelium lacteum]|eukprot:KYQ92920.1 cystathionine-beta-synthase domain-containing protein [Tieghemostelium lacteum]